MFKFNFEVDEDTSNVFNKSDEQENLCNSETDSTEYDACQVLIHKEIFDNWGLYKLTSTEVNINGISLNLMVSGFLPKDGAHKKDILRADQNHSDLIPGVYEGGAKIWECTDDLLKFISKYWTNDRWQQKYVLDLGCGAGWLGIYAFKSGAKVCFQDYNEDVLETLTIPNYLLNDSKFNHSSNEAEFDLLELNNETTFYSGDWSKYTRLTENDTKFDIILTSETIYNPANHQKLLNTMHSKLKPDGIVLLAAKTYYFGVGGGLRQFEKLITQDGRFQARSLWHATEGVSREIIEIKHL